MPIKISPHWLSLRRRFGSVRSLMSSRFNIYTNNYDVSSSEFFSEVYLMSKKLVYYVNDYFRLNDWESSREKKIGCLFPPCYSQLVFKFCVLMNNYDYISIPTPIKKSKQIKQKYSFYISENNIDLILCHPFYKHYIEEISFNLQIPFLICYDKPDILSHEEYLDDLKEGRETFGHKFLYHPKKYEHFMSDKMGALKEMKEKHFNNITAGRGINDFFAKVNNTNEHSNKMMISATNDISPAFHLQLSKENECDKSIKFLLTDIFNQSQKFADFMRFSEKNNTVLMCIPANNIQYFDALFGLLYSDATIIFPEMRKKKILNYNNYMEWFKTHMRNKNNNFQVHNLIIKKDFTDIDFDFIDGPDLFEELFHSEKPINMIVCNNYLIRDFLIFFKNSDINTETKREFIQNKASSVGTIILNGNEIMPGINIKYVEQIKDIFVNAKIYQRYVVQEVGTVSIMELGKLEEDNIPYERKLAGYILPNINIEIDSKTNVLKIKSENLFSEYYNNDILTTKSFDKSGFFKTKYIASLTENSLLKIEGIHNEIENIPDEYYLYFKQRRDKMEKHPPGYLKRVRLQGQIWGNFHANKRNWKRKF
ncbi:hypothetical protein, conserved [Plasmodium gonderi]|uniref:AMP-dependent synthetase/ligase domain-containing protein n=1 Tax=Plasmodium gonderi TaxID=77519 RepID=A0A1Y1JDF1_PLAGO|nr:hypothetical protein, conserved [Plasmodium gonderi]GAW80516.1 hypothetical protein, conserved [Plasmodium gonderi]